jgi:hypothetical protein
MTLTDLFANGAVTWNQVQNLERFTKRMADGYQADPAYNHMLSIRENFGVSCQDFMASVKAWHLLELSERFNVPYSKLMGTPFSSRYCYGINSYLIGTPTYFSCIGDFKWIHKQKEATLMETGVYAFARLMHALTSRTVTTTPLVAVVSPYNELYWDNFAEVVKFMLETTGTIDIAKAIKDAFPKEAHALGTTKGSDFFRAYTGLTDNFIFSEQENTCLFLKLQLDHDVPAFVSSVKQVFAQYQS